MPEAVSFLDYVRSFFYADDAAFVNMAKKENNDTAQNNTLLNKVKQTARKSQDWADKNHAIISYKKTKVMHIGKGNFGNIKIKKSSIEEVDTFKYLGCNIDRNLKGSDHVSDRIARTRKILPRIRAHAQHFSIENRSNIIRTFAQPVNTYGWKPMMGLMSQGTRQIWNAHSKQLQYASLNTTNAPSEIVDKVATIPQLKDFVDSQAHKHSIELIQNTKPHNNLTEKIIFSLPKNTRTDKT